MNETNHGENPKRRGGKNSRTQLSAVERRERDHQCVQLRAAGASWEEIAQRLGYSSPGHAHDRFMKFMIDYPREDAEKARELEALRLDRLQRALWPQCLREDKNQHWAIDRVLKISDQRARLLGLNRPVRQEITVISEDAVDNANSRAGGRDRADRAQAGITLEDDPVEIVPE